MTSDLASPAKDSIIPKPYPREFLDHLVRVARGREPGVTIEQIAKDSGVHAVTSHKWLQRAAVDHGVKPGVICIEAVELREPRKSPCLIDRFRAHPD